MGTPQKAGRWRRFAARLARDRRGAVLVETALILPLLMLFLVIVFDLGSLWAREMSVTNALRAGSQYAMVRKPVGGNVEPVRAAVLEAGPRGMNAGAITTRFYCACPDGTPVACSAGCSGGADRQSFLTVGYEEVYELLLRYPGFDRTVPIRAEATVRLN